MVMAVGKGQAAPREFRPASHTKHGRGACPSNLRNPITCEGDSSQEICHRPEVAWSGCDRGRRRG